MGLGVGMGAYLLSGGHSMDTIGKLRHGPIGRLQYERGDSGQGWKKGTGDGACILWGEAEGLCILRRTTESVLLHGGWAGDLTKKNKWLSLVALYFLFVSCIRLEYYIGTREKGLIPGIYWMAMLLLFWIEVGCIKLSMY